MEIKTTEEISVANYTKVANKKWVAVDEVEEALISLAYQKIKGKLARIDIDHREVMKRLHNLTEIHKGEEK